MRQTDEILDALESHYSPENLSTTLSQLLRVPRAWDQLRDPTLRERLLEDHAERPLKARDVASWILGGQGTAGFAQALRAPSKAEASRQLWERITGDNGQATQSFEEDALLAMVVPDHLTSYGVPSLMEELERDFEFWRTPLAVAWDSLSGHGDILYSLASSGQPAALSLGLHCLLANGSAEDAANALISVDQASIRAWLMQADREGESALIAGITKGIIQDSENASSRPFEWAAHNSPLFESMAYAAKGERDEAKKVLAEAWDSAARHSAEIADTMARLAASEGNGVLEREARQQALHMHPTPSRRARYSLSLLSLGQVDEALELLSGEPHSFQERLAKGMAYAECAMTSSAERTLMEAYEQVKGTGRCAEDWYQALAEGFRKISRFDLSLEVQRLRISTYPASVPARLDFAEFMADTGNPQGGISHTRVAMALDRNVTRAKRLLARLYQSSGQGIMAMAHWQPLIDHVAEAEREYTRSAILSGKVHISQPILKQMVDQNSESGETRLLMGEHHIAAGDLRKAIQELQAALQIDPDNPEAWIALAKAQAENGDPIEAGATLATGADRIPENPMMNAALAEWLYRNERYQEALIKVQVALDQQPHHIEWNILKGSILQRSGRPDEARAWLENLTRRFPDSQRAQHGLIKILIEQDDAGEAASLCHDLPKNSDPELLFDAARAWITLAERGDRLSLNRAVQTLEALQQRVDSPEANCLRARALELSGEINSALSTYQGCLHSPDLKTNLEWYRACVLGIARTALQTGQLPVAISTLEEFSQEEPDDVQILAMLSSAYLQADLTERALKTAQLALEGDSHSPEALSVLADAHLSQKDYRSAQETYLSLVEIEPENVAGWLGIARAAKELKDIPTLRKSTARALMIGRKDADVLQESAAMIEAAGEPRSAKRLLKAALNVRPNDLSLLQSFARLSTELQDSGEAVKSWMRCIELEPNNALIIERAAQSMKKLGQYTKAVGMWQRALRLKPEDLGVQRKLAHAYFQIHEIDRALQLLQTSMENHPDDLQLAFETAAMAMQHDRLAEASAILEGILERGEAVDQASTKLAECFYRMGEYEKASGILTPSIEGDTPSSQALSMYALIRHQLQDLPASSEAYQRAMNTPAKTKEDVLWLSRAAAALGDWQSVLSPLEGGLVEAGDEAFLVLELIEQRLNIAEAYWLFDWADAVQHQPEEHFSSEHSKSVIDDLIAKLSSKQVSVLKMDELHRRAQLLFEGYSTDILENRPSMLKGRDASAFNLTLAISMKLAGQIDQAERILKNELERMDHPSSRMGAVHGFLLMDLERWDSAIEAFKSSMRDTTIQPIHHYGLAKAWKALGNMEEATRHLNMAVNAWPGEPKWRFQLGSMYLENAQPDAALSHLESAHHHLPDQPSATVALARAQAACGRLSEAYATFGNALEGEGSLDAEVCIDAGEIALSLGEVKQAYKWFDRATELAPAHEAALLGAARAAMKQNDLRTAEEKVDAALRIHPESAGVLTCLGDLLSSQGKFDQALQAYEEAETGTSDKGRLYAARSKALIGKNEPGKAMLELEKAIDLDPENADLWAELATAAEGAGDPNRALSAWTKAIKLVPRAVPFRLQAARVAREIGQLDLSLDELVKAINIDPDNPDIALELGQLYETRRELGNSLKAYQRAIDLDGKCAEAYYRAGLIHRSLKSYPQAGEMLKRAVELRPDDRTALHQLAAVRALELVHGGIQTAEVAT